MKLIHLSIFLFCFLPSTLSMTKKEKAELRETVKDMFRHAYNSYMTYAYPADELMPLTCKGRYRDIEPSRGDVDDILGNFSMTLIDSLDSLAIFGEIKEFERGVRLVIDNVEFDNDVVVSVFETNIRVVGGLLGGHVAADVFKKAGIGMSWYNGELLDLAEDIGGRLLPAFNTTTGIPYPRVNLKYGVSDPRSRTGTESDTCTACAGTMIMEFGALSRLTGDPVFETVAHKAMMALWTYRSRSSDLVGTVINIHNGEWVRRDSGVGAGIDSYYEYCLKAYILLGEEDYLQRFNQHYKAVMRYINKGSLFLNVHMHNPSRLSFSYMDSLQAFWPGLQVLKGDLKAAIELHEVFYSVAKRHTFLPEAFTTNFEVHWGQHLLRPELVESTYFLYEATKDPHYLAVGKYIVDNLNRYTRVPCGFAAVKDVRTLSHEDRMDSFLLSETLKYLYLLFTEKEDLIIDIHDFVFTTEAHILPLALSNWNGSSNQNNFFKSEHLHDHSCPSTIRDGSMVSFSEEVRRKSRLKKASTCPKQEEEKEKASSITDMNTPPLLRAEQFIPGNTEHLQILKSMGITVTKTDDGKVQLMQNAAVADTSEMAAEGIKFMQSMIELAKYRSEDGGVEHLPRVVQILSPPYNGKIVLNAGSAQFGIDLGKSGMGLSAEVILADPFKGCTPLINKDFADHRIVVMERGDCMFIDKVRQAESCGAVGVIIIDNNPGSSSESQPMFAMSGDGTSASIKIPAVFLFSNEGQVLLNAMEIITRNTKENLRVRLADKAKKDLKTGESLPQSEDHSSQAAGAEHGHQETVKNEARLGEQESGEHIASEKSATEKPLPTSQDVKDEVNNVNKLMELMKNVVNQPGFEFLTNDKRIKNKACMAGKLTTKDDSDTWLYDMVVKKLKEDEMLEDFLVRQKAAEKADLGALDKNTLAKDSGVAHQSRANQARIKLGDYQYILRAKETIKNGKVYIFGEVEEKLGSNYVFGEVDEKLGSNREVLEVLPTGETAGSVHSEVNKAGTKGKTSEGVTEGDKGAVEEVSEGFDKGTNEIVSEKIGEEVRDEEVREEGDKEVDERTGEKKETVEGVIENTSEEIDKETNERVNQEVRKETGEEASEVDVKGDDQLPGKQSETEEDLYIDISVETVPDQRIDEQVNAKDYSDLPEEGSPIVSTRRYASEEKLPGDTSQTLDGGENEETPSNLNEKLDVTNVPERTSDESQTITSESNYPGEHYLVNESKSPKKFPAPDEL